MELTKDKEAMKQLMTVLDANSGRVQAKHYRMDDPDDDYELALALIKAVLGETVRWPSAEDAAAEVSESLEQMLEGVLEHSADDRTDDHCDDCEDDPDDEPDEYWQNGELFGVTSVDVSNVLPLTDCGDTGTLQPIADAVHDAPSTLVQSDERQHAHVAPDTPLASDVHPAPSTPLACDAHQSMQLATAPAATSDVRMDVDRQLAPPPPVSNNMKPREVAKAKQAFYALYEVDKIPGVHHKNKVCPEAYTAMETALAKWQADVGHDSIVLPPKDWFWDLRCFLIDTCDLTTFHSWDVCRSHLSRVAKRNGAV
jgi:hypothetical protein